MKRLIVTADDFGLCPEVNGAVVRAHAEGILTCASLMVGAEAASEAVALARSNPGLRVGLHLVLVEGRSVLERSRIPDLVDEGRRFPDAVAWTGARYYFSRAALDQARAECEAQVRAFLATGLEMDHINAHNHLHIHPSILDIVLELAKGYGIPAVRLPRQPWRSLPPRQALTAAVMAPWVARTRSRLREAGLAFNDEVYGLFETGRMTEDAWLRLIPSLRDGVTEVYCHPALADADILLEHMPGYRRREELQALLSPEVRRRLEDAGVERISFRSIRG